MLGRDGGIGVAQEETGDGEPAEALGLPNPRLLQQGQRAAAGTQNQKLVRLLDATRTEIAQLKRQLAMGGAQGEAAPKEINGIKLIARVLDGVDGKGLRGVAEDFRKQVGSGVVALIGVTDGRAAVTVAATSDMAGRVNAADLARAAVLAMGGQGAGGKPDFAQGGAPDGSKAEDIVANAPESTDNFFMVPKVVE